MTIAENNTPKPALLLVLDGIRPDVLRAAIRDGEAPNLGALAERGEAVWDAVSVFPSITPAATAAIATGEAPAKSGIVGHAWYDEDERRVVVYGAMTETVMASGPIKVFHNNVWRMNRDDLHAATLFETLHDRGFDGACVNFPVRRGPHTHPIRMKTVEGYLKGGRYLGPSVEGPKEYFMGDLFYSRDTGFSGRKANGGVLRSVGINDDYAARVGAMLLKEKAAPFNLVYFFKGDSIAHHHGLEAQRRLARDRRRVRRQDLRGRWRGRPGARGLRRPRALGPRARATPPQEPLRGSAHDPGPDSLFRGEGPLRQRRHRRRGPERAFGAPLPSQGRRAGSVVERLVGRRGVDLAAWIEGDWATVRRPGREVRFQARLGTRGPVRTILGPRRRPARP